MITNTMIALAAAFLLGTGSLAQARIPSHHVVHTYRHASVLPVVFGSDAYDSYGIQPSQRRLPGETPSLPWTQDPASPRM
jgi:hypothetical protein